MRRVVMIGTLWAVLSAPAAHAQSWIDQVFPERSFDFGTVAKGSKVRHSFKVLNRLDQDVRIVDWRTKCGCTEVKIGSMDIPPGVHVHTHNVASARGRGDLPPARVDTAGRIAEPPDSDEPEPEAAGPAAAPGRGRQR